VISDRALDITPLGALPGFCQLTRVAVQSALPGYRHEVARRTRGNGIVQVTLAGSGWCRRGSAPVQPVPPGTAMIFHSGLHREVVYGLPEGGRWDFLYVDLDGAAARSGLDDLVAARGHVVPLSAEHPALRACARLLPQAALAHRSMPAAEAARLGGGVLLALAEVVGRPGDRLVLAAMDWLRDRLDRPVAIAGCAAALGVSREHLTRRFAAEVGDSPARWLVRQRIARARAMLALPGATVAVVARGCGFATPAHFAAVFRATTGLRPREALRVEAPVASPGSPGRHRASPP